MPPLLLLYRYCYTEALSPLKSHDTGANYATLFKALVFGNTLGRACPSRVRCPVFLPRDWHGGLGDDDFTIPIVPIRRPRMEAAYDPWKLPTFDLYATGVPVGVLTGSPPMTPGSRKPSN